MLAECQLGKLFVDVFGNSLALAQIEAPSSFVLEHEASCGDDFFSFTAARGRV
ncbi:hypothetical protein D3C81_2050670 [compost metagenome]